MQTELNPNHLRYRRYPKPKSWGTTSSMKTPTGLEAWCQEQPPSHSRDKGKQAPQRRLVARGCWVAIDRGHSQEMLAKLRGCNPLLAQKIKHHIHLKIQEEINPPTDGSIGRTKAEGTDKEMHNHSSSTCRDSPSSKVQRIQSSLKEKPVLNHSRTKTRAAKRRRGRTIT